MTGRRAAAALLAVGLFAAAGCSSSHSSPTAASSTSTTAVASGAVPQGADAAGTVWLCRPGEVEDPCAGRLAATVVPASGDRARLDPAPDDESPFDCFYVYPTVSTETTANSDLLIQPAERTTAIDQASQFSPVCRVWAPMYRQVTVSGLLKGDGDNQADLDVAYQSLLSGWRDYLENFNDGRPVIFIGHSQGSAMLIRLLAAQVDADPSVRSRMLMAILPGGNVAVPTGGTVGATFAHLPLCTATGQDGCVIAYSTFPGQPPSDSLFGRPGTGVSITSGQTQTSGVQVACTNPADLGGGTADLESEFPTVQFPPKPTVPTPWVVYPDLYSAQCRSASGATWLQVTTLATAGRPVVTESLGPEWGYHLEDVNLPLGNLVSDVTAAEKTWTAAHG